MSHLMKSSSEKTHLFKFHRIRSYLQLYLSTARHITSFFQKTIKTCHVILQSVFTCYFELDLSVPFYAMLLVLTFSK